MVKHGHLSPLGHQRVEAEGADKAGLGLVGDGRFGIGPGNVAQVVDELVGKADALVDILVTALDELVFLGERKVVELEIRTAAGTGVSAVSKVGTDVREVIGVHKVVAQLQGSISVVEAVRNIFLGLIVAAGGNGVGIRLREEILAGSGQEGRYGHQDN